MSTQLILYPQNYSGYSYSTTPIFNQYMGDWQLKYAFFNTATANGTLNFMSAIMNSSPAVLGSWSAFYYSGTPASTQYAAVSAPTINGQLTLTGGSSGSLLGLSGVYQLVSNLTIGDQYDININIASGGSAAAYYIGAPIWTSSGATPPAIEKGYVNPASTITFTATANTMIFVLRYQSASNVVIESISIQENAANPVLAYNNLSDGQVICDLYKEENIPLTLSVDDFTNIAEKVQSYSKDFDLPNTKKNNKIFTHIFEITKTIATGSDFNPYAKTRAVLKQDGVLIFEGSLRLIEIKDNEGEISYNVNLYSETISLAEVLQDRNFSDLDLSELAHTYNKTSIKNSWDDSTGLPLDNALTTTSFAYDAAIGVNNTNVLKYPFCNWEGDILLATSFNNNATAGMPELVRLEQAFRPWIQIKYLIEKIFDAAGYQFTSLFFDTTDFKKLFMDFNWGVGNTPTIISGNSVTSGYYIGSATNYAPNGSYGNLQLNAFSSSLAQVDYDTSNNKITCTTDNTQYNINYFYEINILNVSPDPKLGRRWLITYAAGGTQEVDLLPIQTVSANQIMTYSGILSVTLNNGDTLEPQFYSDGTNVIVQNFDGVTSPPLATATVTINTSVLNIASGNLLNTLRGEINQWGFLKGIMTMFNLITMPDPENPNNILIEPYKDVFGVSPSAVTSTKRQWTNKVDVKEMQLSPLELTRNIIFKYEEDEGDYSSKIYKNALNGYLYGSKELDGSNVIAGVTNIVGDQEIIASPFAATICKPIHQIFPEFITPTIYSSNEEGNEFEGFDNKPRILYNNGAVTLPNAETYYIPAQNALSSENTTQFLQFSHLSDIQPIATDRDFNFGECQLIGINAATINNLYNTYYSQYFNELYDPNTRTMKMKVNLNAADINTFKFYDTVFIKNREFRVNKIDYKPNDLSTVEFILIP